MATNAGDLNNVLRTSPWPQRGHWIVLCGRKLGDTRDGKKPTSDSRSDLHGNRVSQGSHLS